MGTIVLIEREPGLSATFRLLLERAGHSVYAESNGADGIHRCRDVIPELVISHVNSGKGAVWHREFIRKLRTELPRTPIVTLSGSTDPQLGEELRTAGSDRHIQLPIPSGTFLEAVDQVLFDYAEIKTDAAETPLSASNKPDCDGSVRTFPSEPKPENDSRTQRPGP